MKLWKESDSGGIGSAVRVKVKEQVADINRQALSRGTRAVNALRTAELEVLKGQRGGKVYKKSGTYGAPTSATRKLSKDYAHKLKGGQLYRASAPGEPPARRTGALRLHWNGNGKKQVIAELESGEKYASMLEEGTTKMAPRPFVEKIKEEAMPEIQRIYSESYT